MVSQDHQDFLRFPWFKDNDPTEKIAEYRMNVHLFPNSPSPAVAIYGLRRAALQGEEEHSTEAKQFVLKNFYIDDGLASFPAGDDATRLLKENKETLVDSNIRLHKMVLCQTWRCAEETKVENTLLSSVQKTLFLLICSAATLQTRAMISCSCSFQSEALSLFFYE